MTKGGFRKPSDALRDLMRENADYLSKQTGVRHVCADCGRDILNSELSISCKGGCQNANICVDCLDGHHALKHQDLSRQRPN